MRSVCLDASSLVIYVAEKDSPDDMSGIMNDIEKGNVRGVISTVNLAEFHRAITRIFSEDKADKFVAWMNESTLEIISPTVEIACIASEKKYKYARTGDPFAWGDAFCLATAIHEKADLIITSHAEFEKVTEISIMMI